MRTRVDAADDLSGTVLAADQRFADDGLLSRIPQACAQAPAR
jgi:hypothetical protein